MTESKKTWKAENRGYQPSVDEINRLERLHNRDETCELCLNDAPEEEIEDGICNKCRDFMDTNDLEKGDVL